MKKPRKKCPDTDAYSTETPPSCATDKYLTCDACVEKWQTAQADRIRRANAGNTKWLHALHQITGAMALHPSPDRKKIESWASHLRWVADGLDEQGRMS